MSGLSQNQSFSCFFHHLYGHRLQVVDLQNALDPNRIGMGGLSPIQQVKLLTIDSFPLMSKRQKGGINVLDDLADAVVARRLPSLLLCNSDHLTMNSSHRPLWFL